MFPSQKRRPKAPSLRLLFAIRNHTTSAHVCVFLLAPAGAVRVSTRTCGSDCSTKSRATDETLAATTRASAHVSIDGHRCRLAVSRRYRNEPQRRRRWFGEGEQRYGSSAVDEIWAAVGRGRNGLPEDPRGRTYTAEEDLLGWGEGEARIALPLRRSRYLRGGASRRGAPNHRVITHLRNYVYDLTGRNIARFANHKYRMTRRGLPRRYLSFIHIDPRFHPFDSSPSGPYGFEEILGVSTTSAGSCTSQIFSHLKSNQRPHRRSCPRWTRFRGPLRYGLQLKCTTGRVVGSDDGGNEGHRPWTMAMHVHGEIEDAHGNDKAGSKPSWLPRWMLRPIGKRTPSITNGLLVILFEQ